MLKATPTIYCYYFPEVRKVIDSIVKKYPHKIFLKSIIPGLDKFHEPIIERYIRYVKQAVSGLGTFAFRYPVNGASEAIFHLIAHIKTHEPKTPLYTIEGDYQGYKQYADRLKLKIKEVSKEETTEPKLKKGIFFISNPNAHVGEILSNSFIQKVVKRHRLVLDITYVGITRPFNINVQNKNIIAVLSSFSKPMGLYYYRVGFVFSRQEIPTLWPNKWFKNIFSLIIADRLMKKIKFGSLYKKYRPIQEKIIEGLNKKYGLNMYPSEVPLLGLIDPKQVKKTSPETREMLLKYFRNDVYRLCITQYFIDYESR